MSDTECADHVELVHSTGIQGSTAAYNLCRWQRLTKERKLCNDVYDTCLQLSLTVQVMTMSANLPKTIRSDCCDVRTSLAPSTTRNAFLRQFQILSSNSYNSCISKPTCLIIALAKLVRTLCLCLITWWHYLTSPRSCFY